MGVPLRFESDAAMWRVTPGAGESGSYVAIGGRHIALSHIRSVSLESHHESDWAGLLLVGAASVLAGLTLFAGVVQFDWHAQNLIGTALLCGLGFSSIREGAASTTISYWRLRIEIQNGEVLYTTASAADAQALLRALGQT